MHAFLCHFDLKFGVPLCIQFKAIANSIGAARPSITIVTPKDIELELIIIH